ncbi:hypothetical protein MKW94_013518 [Papaver nudicaule]|uniref:Uncharacterized protein n=1 Tax=Papaver nudicaule TaxID=74823 RepID=A0AA41VF63_PAPNU|nr:hypothetical protein [Papaver nudicaule]
MDDFPSLLNFGVRPQGKAAPMAASRGATTSTLNNASKSAWNSNPSNSFGNKEYYDDVFGGLPKYTTESSSTSIDYVSMFLSGSTSTNAQASGNPSNAARNNNNYGSSSSLPVYDKPVYDDDIFEGFKSTSASSTTKEFDDLLSSVTSPPDQGGGCGSLFDDLLGVNKNDSSNKSDNESGIDDLLSSFGASTSPPNDGGTSTNANSTGAINDPFADFQSTSTPVYDLESFFGMGSRPSSALNSPFDAPFQNKPGPEVPPRETSSATNIVDDLTASMFGASPPSSGDFQERPGESDDKRRIRLGRHLKTQERVLNALAEKNERDLQNQREQAERHRIAETLDMEIRRWAAGKETNLRALLSTLEYVLWPECGWQPVSLTDLITGASVRKVYRKATLCVHPDKVQQKGANLQQKYIAEKVFDLLKEAWNKFNSEELS